MIYFIIYFDSIRIKLILNIKTPSHLAISQYKYAITKDNYSFNTYFYLFTLYNK